MPPSRKDRIRAKASTLRLRSGRVLELFGEIAHRMERGQRRGPTHQIGESICGDEPDRPVVRYWAEREDDPIRFRIVRDEQERRRSAARPTPPGGAQGP
jgi:hypothetical protein